MIRFEFLQQAFLFFLNLKKIKFQLTVEKKYFQEKSVALRQYFIYSLLSTGLMMMLNKILSVMHMDSWHLPSIFFTPLSEHVYHE